MKELFCMRMCIILLCLLYVAEGVTYDNMKTHVESILPSTSSPNLYYWYVRPVADQSNVVNVTANLHLIGINSFDNSEQKLTTTAYLTVQWVDEILSDANRWTNPAIDTTYLPQNYVWKPDLALQNGFDSLTGLGDKFLYVKAESAGNITWTPYHVFDSACEVDVTFFPFDKTTCDLKFVIWGHTKDLVKVTQGSLGLNMDLFESNSEWEVISARATNYETSSTSGVTFSIEMKRKPLYYLLNILIPVMLLGILNAFVFVLPASSGEKSGYGVIVFLAFAVFLSIISRELPQNSERISIFGAYLLIMTFASTIIVVINLLQLRLFSRDADDPIPNSLYSIVGCVRKFPGNRCCVGSGHVQIDEKKRREAEEITWSVVVDALDFVFFWVFLIFMLLFTTIVVLVTILASM